MAINPEKEICSPHMWASMQNTFRFSIPLTAVSCAILFAMSDVRWYRITGLRFKAKKTAAIPSTTRSQKRCKLGGSTTAGSI